jgi:hypothetical protein
MKQMKIDHVKVYDLEESIVASGLPMIADYDETECEKAVRELFLCHLTGDIHGNPHFKRMAKLADTPIGSGHANALSGILVSMNITATVKWWEQFQRYHFKQIVSSMSTMHRLRKMLREGTAEFNSNTDPEIVKKITFLAMENEEVVTDEQLAYSCPMGLELTARITTNYLQLKTIYNQRHNHRLTEWRDFCKEIEILPYAQELILKK